LTEVKRRSKGRNLLHQPLCKFEPGTDLNGRDVINGLVTVEFDTLPTHMGQAIDHMGFDFKQSKLKNLEQTHRPGAYHQGVCFNH
jgi:hypothetical protein